MGGKIMYTYKVIIKLAGETHYILKDSINLNQIQRSLRDFGTVIIDNMLIPSSSLISIDLLKSDNS